MPAPTTHEPSADAVAADDELATNAFAPLLPVYSGWVRFSSWLVPFVGALVVLFVVGATADRYATGPAVVRLTDRTEITARTTGLLASVLINPGERVEAGQILATFASQVEADELRARTEEWEDQLRRYLSNLGDDTSLQALVSLKSAQSLAQQRLSEGTLRAPHSGIVADVRARAGQWLSTGELVCSLIREQHQATVEAFLPGSSRPLVALGGHLVLELSHDRYRYHSMNVSAVDDEVVGPSEVSRALGPAYAELVKVSGPVVRVEALASADSAGLRQYDGATGTATVRLERRRLWELLVLELGQGGP